ncbi:MAG: hypothetical protein ACOCZH_06285, partial [Phototrophicaceae bacterium]
KRTVGEFLLDVAAELVARVIYFVGGALLVLSIIDPMNLLHLLFTAPDLLIAVLLAVAVIAAGIAILGPRIYRRRLMRGRGRLADVRDTMETLAVQSQPAPKTADTQSY